MKIKDEPAFPVMTYKRAGEVEIASADYSGMMLSDHFAGRAMQKLVDHRQFGSNEVAELSYEYAAEMLKARAKFQKRLAEEEKSEP